MPFVSIVVPTRNRPDFVRCALQSILNQTFADFEVIVVDNHTGTPCRAAFDSVADERFRYVVPERPLSMCDNWEFGCRQATGDYVAVVIDKTVLRRTALEVLHTLAGTFSADLVSWRADAFRPRHFRDAFGPGTCYPWPEAMRAPQLFDPHQELARRFRMDVRRGTEGDRYFWGKICFGAFRRDLFDRIAAAAGRVFFPLTPDYTSMLAALALAKTPVDAGQSCLIQNITQISTGWNVAHRPDQSLSFLLVNDPSGAILNELPIPGLYTAVHNIVAHDYVTSQRRLGSHFPHVQLDNANLALRAAEDLQDVEWTELQVREQQHALLRQFLARATTSEAADLERDVQRYAAAAKRARARQRIRSVLQRVPLGEAVLHLPRGRIVDLLTGGTAASNAIRVSSVIAAANA